ncbi:MAG TPA: hypothetical protein VHO06_06315 [Polyangia bacterium]|nr:hypothetical protein [Polyangia bacterium]
MKVVIISAASLLTVTPAFALTRSEIVHHTGGPIPYSQLSSPDRSGYNARAHRGRHRRAPAGEVAANTSTAAGLNAAPGADQSATGAVNSGAAIAPSTATTTPPAAPSPLTSGSSPTTAPAVGSDSTLPSTNAPATGSTSTGGGSGENATGAATSPGGAPQ